MFNNHKLSFKFSKYKNATTLSMYYWKIKREVSPIKLPGLYLKSSICKNARGRYKLCLEEIFVILNLSSYKRIFAKKQS